MPPKHEKASRENQNVHELMDVVTGTIILTIWKSFSKCRAGIAVNPVFFDSRYVSWRNYQIRQLKYVFFFQAIFIKATHIMKVQSEHPPVEEQLRKRSKQNMRVHTGSSAAAKRKDCVGQCGNASECHSAEKHTTEQVRRCCKKEKKKINLGVAFCLSFVKKKIDK